MNQRLEAVHSLRPKTKELFPETPTRHSLELGMHTFHLRAMEQVFPKKVMQNLQAVFEGRERLDPEHADLIAAGLKDWAVAHGATHFTHWFQPLRRNSAAKHDSFLSFSDDKTPVEKLQAKDLFRGESDASSLPSGGLRGSSTARGYTTWDPASPPFLWKGKEGVTLCLPSLYFSYTSHALDYKTSLLRSEEKLKKTVLSLFQLFGKEEVHIFSTLGCEQEYFIIDKRLYSLRPDLLFAHRTVFGAEPPKGQELEDHYFGAIEERVFSFIREFEERAILLGIPVKTRHNEVAPSQFEVAPLFERTPLAADHNVLLMEIMRQVAEKHDLAVLFHEKPFFRFNGSGKHCNWSIGTDRGENLFDPSSNPLLFLTLLTALIRGAFEQAGLIRAALGSLGNDYRLGGAEAPPAILSIDLGVHLEEMIGEILHQKETLLRKIDLGLTHIAPYEIDSSDRNRTAFLAFSGNKFELRAVGASQNPALPVMALNAAVSDALSLIVDEIADVLKGEVVEGPKLLEKVLPVLQKHLKYAEPILFLGDNYSSAWKKEALARGLKAPVKSFHAFRELLDKKTLRAMEGILSEKELESHYEIFVERYAKEAQVELRLMIEMFQTQILPVALLDQKRRANSLLSLENFQGSKVQKEQLCILSSTIDTASLKIAELETILLQVEDFGWEGKAQVFSEIGARKMEEAREWVDRLEMLIDNSLWPFPKYRELLFPV